jgi:hypothetical protein
MAGRYTNAVLTVIATALCALVVQNAMRPSRASSVDIPQVQICNQLGLQCADIVPARDGTGHALLVRDRMD